MNREISTIEKFVAILFALIVCVFTVYTQFVIAGFDELFSETNVVIPKSTQLVFTTFRWWVLLLVIAVIGVYQVIYVKNRKGWWLLSSALIFITALLPITVWSMYEPFM
ncbi:MAG: hypothetical protein ABW127_14095 [Candidatus Thiodiazotropha endolucinida]